MVVVQTDHGMDDIIKIINEKTVLYTDVFNVYNFRFKYMNDFKNFNFIINDDDIITFTIMKNFVKNINLNDTSLIKVYMNPNEIYDNVAIIFIKPPKSNILFNEKITCKKVFKYPFKKLIIDDNSNIKKITISIDNLPTRYIEDRIWQYNPALPDHANAEIIMQKLIGSRLKIDQKTYDKLKYEINNFKKLKILEINSIQNQDFTCSNKNFKYSKFGYDLTKWPI